MLIAAVCTGNTCRSPMLERLLHRALNERGLVDFSVVSAGVAASDGDPASAHAITCMSDYGIDLSDHRSRHISHLDLPRVQLFITMSDRHAALLRSLGVDAERIVVAGEEEGIPDPFGGAIDDYKGAAQSLAQVAEDFAAAAEARKHSH
ncbi:MAG: low molecular weight phosphatase family protein [Planctomycetota bacterium]|nr:MAG: low molecular weight phosphatase family protein [Planctomycetota bacterium]